MNSANFPLPGLTSPHVGKETLQITERRTVPPSVRTPSGVLSCYPLEPVLTLGRMAALIHEHPRSMEFCELLLYGVLRTSP
jgi:hypothetical protein